MTKTQPEQRHELGIVGLGVMGRNLLLNMADHGFCVAGYDRDPNQVATLRKEAAARDIRGADNIGDFTALLRPPRAAVNSGLFVVWRPPMGAVQSAPLDIRNWRE